MTGRPQALTGTAIQRQLVKKTAREMVLMKVIQPGLSNYEMKVLLTDQGDEQPGAISMF